MPKNRRASIGWLGAVLRGHFSLWMHSMRTILMTVFVLLMTYMLVRSYEYNISTNQYEVHIWETLYSYSNTGFNMIMTSVAFLVMMSEIPRRIAYQNYSMFRLSRNKWVISLFLFCLGIAFVFTIMMYAVAALFSISFVTPGNEWSDIERLAKDANYIFEKQLVPNYIREILPSEACLFAAIILLLFWTTIAFSVLLFSLYGATNFGVILCVSLLLLNITILFESLPGIKLPSQYATLAAIAAQAPGNELRFTLKVACVYIAIDIAMIWKMIKRVRSMDIKF